jgi:uncharacterized membrane protein
MTAPDDLATELGPQPTVEQFVDRVEAACADLPGGQRRRLLADLEEHLRERLGDAGGLSELGPPETYARELRAAAGLAEGPASAMNAVTAVDGGPAPGGSLRWAALTARAGWLTRRAVLIGLAGLLVLLALIVVGLIAVNAGSTGSSSQVGVPVVSASASAGATFSTVVTVPAVVGLTTSVATDKLEAVGLIVVVAQVGRSGAPVGTVVSQTPAPYSQVPVGATVQLQVSAN